MNRTILQRMLPKRILLPTAFLSFVLVLVAGRLQAQIFEDVLDADGRIIPGKTFRGNLDPQGWTLSIDPDGTPRFSPKNEANGSAPLSSVAAAAEHPDDIYWDNAFGSSGVVGAIRVVAISGCNDVYVGGKFDGIGGIPARNVARWDGAAWHSLGIDDENGVSGQVNAIAFDGDDVYIGGRFDRAGTLTVNNITRWDGSEWHELDGGVDAYDEWELPTPGEVKAIAVDKPYIYVAGRFDTVRRGAMPVNNIARWDGAEWQPMENGLQGDGSGQPPDLGEVNTLVVGFNGLYAGGRFVRSGSTQMNGVARWDGVVWRDVGGSLAATGDRVQVYALALNGPDLYVGGRFDRAGEVNAKNIAVWTGMLGQWIPFGEGSSTPVRTLDVYGTTVYASGSFTSPTGGKPNNIAFWDGSGWRPLGRPENNGTDTAVYSIAISSSNVYVAGVFGTAGPATAGGIAIWDVATQTWRPLNKNASSGGGVIGAVYALALTDDFLYVGGRFGTAGLVKTNSLARWNRQTRVWSALGGGVAIDPTISTTILPSVRAIVVDGQNIYVGGRFDYAGGVRANNIAKWDGVQWSPLGKGIGPNLDGGPYDSTSAIYALAAKDGIVYAGGEFILAGGERANRIAKWEESTRTWTALGGGIGGSSFNTRVNAVAIGPQGVYVGGIFPVAGEVRASNIALFDGAAWQALGRGVNNAVFALAVGGDGTLYAGGNFSTAGDRDAENIARWNGTAWQPMGVGVNQPVRGLAVGPQGVYATGDFLFSLAEQTSRVARWNGTYWEGLGSGLTNQIGMASGYAVAVDGDDVFFGGTFTIAGSKSALNLAKWSKPGSGIVFDPDNDGSDVRPVTAGVDAREAAATAGALVELQPNPVAADAAFRLHIPAAAEMRLTLYDAMGRTVATLHDGPLPEGETLLRWDSRNLPSGMYFYRLNSRGMERSGRIIVQR